MDRMIKETIEYCRQRRTFDAPLIDNQYIYFRLAELQAEVELLRALLNDACGKWSLCLLFKNSEFEDY